LTDIHGNYRAFNHGRLQHGLQYDDLDKRAWKTAYYSQESGFGVAVDMHPRRMATDDQDRSLQIGVIGLGTGAMAAHGRPGDVIRFYEIDPEIERIAREHFTYCRDSPAEITIAVGDARVNLERELAREGSRQFDVLAVDAFTSDAIPMHLLTRECFDLYWQHLKADGILAVHISNRYLDLKPVIHGLAKDDNRSALLVQFDNVDDDPAVSASTWVLVTTNQDFIDSEEVQKSLTELDERQLIWTDDFGSLLQVLMRDEP
jgi:hypothetical protein